MKTRFRKKPVEGDFNATLKTLVKGALLIEAQKVFKKALNSLNRQAFKRDLKKNILKNPTYKNL